MWVSPTGSIYVPDGDRFRYKGKYKPPNGDCRNGKLTVADVEYIKGQIEAGANQTWLSKKFGVSAVMITLIAKGQTWKDVEAPIAELEGPPKGVHKERWAEFLPYDDEVLATVTRR